MTRLSLNPNQPQIEALFAAERALVPESAALRERVMERVHASVPRHTSTLSLGRSPRLRRLRSGELAAAAVLLSTFCAAAFYVGYHTNDEQVGAPTALPVPALPSIVPALPSIVPALPSIVPALPGAPSGSQSAPLEVAPLEPNSVKSNSAGPAKVISESEAFVKELRVLQPARQALASQEFSLALSAISEHHRQYPSGKLTEEREALRVKALLGVGRTAEAQRAGAAFRARFPRSALLGRIDEMLGRPK